MIQKHTYVYVGDNSGAKRAMVIFVYKNILATKGLATKVLVTLRRVVPNNVKKLKKGDKFKALVVQQKQPVNKATYFCRSLKNAVILLRKGEDDLPLGTRIYVKISKGF
jgi:ribosomal protein L14